MENDYTPVGDVSLDKMFERFYKGEGSFNKKGSYGLGLAIAKVIVHRHGGTASAKSVDTKKINICIELGKS